MINDDRPRWVQMGALSFALDENHCYRKEKTSVRRNVEHTRQEYYALLQTASKEDKSVILCMFSLQKWNPLRPISYELVSTPHKFCVTFFFT